MITNISLYPIPIPFVIANLFTGCTDGKKTAQGLDLCKGFLEFCIPKSKAIAMFFMFELILHPEPDDGGIEGLCYIINGSQFQTLCFMVCLIQSSDKNH